MARRKGEKSGKPESHGKSKTPGKGGALTKLARIFTQVWESVDKALGGELSFVADDLNKRKYVYRRGEIIKSGSTLLAFYGEARWALWYCLLEPEIMLFSFMNALSLLLALSLFVYGFHVATPQVYDGISITGLIILWPLWLLACLWLLSNLTGIFTGAMGLSVIKRKKGDKSSVMGCLMESLKRRREIQRCEWHVLARSLLMLANMIPSKNASRAETEKGKREFYAWRYGKFAILPYILMGKTLVEAGKESAEMVKRNFANVCLFRTGYSRARFLLWLTTWALMTWLFTYGPGGNPDKPNLFGMIIVQALFSLLPTFILVKIFLSPVLVISSCRRTLEDMEAQPEHSS